ncbi:MAG: hypothetical protein QOG53_1066 [Frankiales bacterium]|jgi:hypothetical protein|nr:hypothetical protein [Frankiales bacterium]
MRPSRIAISLLLIGAFVGLGVATSPAAHAACAASTLPNQQQLKRLITGAPTVFVGTVTSRGDAREVAGVVYTPVTFKVAVFLHGTAHRSVTLLTFGGALPGQGGVSSGEAQTYEGGGLQLAAAAASHGELISEDVCYGTGEVSASMVRELVALANHPTIYDDRFLPTPPVDTPKLPFTGPVVVLRLALVGAALLVGGCAMLAMAAMRRQRS